MFVYEIADVLESLKTAQEDGFEYVSISLTAPEEDMGETLSLDYINEPESSENDMIDSIILPDDYCNYPE